VTGSTGLSDIQTIGTLICALQALRELVPAAFESIKVAMHKCSTTRKRADDWVSCHYDAMRLAVSPRSATLLRQVCAHPGQQSRDYRKMMYPALHLDGDAQDHFDKEFQYRMDYLVLVGVLVQEINRYHLTEVGAAFLRATVAEGDVAWLAGPLPESA